MQIAYRNDTTAWASVDSAQKATYAALVDTSKVTANKRAGETLRGRLYSHVISKRTRYEVTFSSDVLVTNGDRTFMQAFFTAMNQALYIDSSWVDVQLEGGDEPIEFIEGHKEFWEYKFVFQSVEPL